MSSQKTGGKTNRTSSTQLSGGSTPKVPKVKPKTKLTVDQRLEQYSTTRKGRIVTLWLQGLKATEIAKRLKIPLSACSNQIKQAKLQAQSLGVGELKGLLINEFQKLLNANNQVGLELMLQLTTRQVDRDEMLQQGMTTNSRAVASKDRDIRDVITSIQQQQKTFVDLVARMGVPRVDEGDEKGSHPHGPALVEYEKITPTEARRLALESLERQREYLLEQERLDPKREVKGDPS